MKDDMKLCVFGVFCLAFSLAASEARAQGITVAPTNPVIASGDTQPPIWPSLIQPDRTRGKAGVTPRHSGTQRYDGHAKQKHTRKERGC